MNKMAKTTWRELWQAWVDYCHRDKTKFDLIDRARALLLLGVICLAIYLLVELLFS
jgi:hypothetical protein